MGTFREDASVLSQILLSVLRFLMKTPLDQEAMLHLDLHDARLTQEDVPPRGHVQWVIATCSE